MTYETELFHAASTIAMAISTCRPSPIADPLVKFYVELLADGPLARDENHCSDLAEIQAFLAKLPLPPFDELVTAVMAGCRPARERAGLESELKTVLLPLIANSSFNEEWYVATYPDVAGAAKDNAGFRPHSHYITHGYFEGRLPRPDDPIFR
jgi:hypothetical protein